MKQNKGVGVGGKLKEKKTKIREQHRGGTEKKYKRRKKPNQGSNCICQERKLKRQSGKLKK